MKLKSLLPEVVVDLAMTSTGADSIINDALPMIKRLGNKRVLFRGFKHSLKLGPKRRQVAFHIANIQPDDWRGGRLAYSAAFKNKTDTVMDNMSKLVDAFDMDNIVYCKTSYGSTLFGTEYIVVPYGIVKTIWNPEVNDVFVYMSQNGELPIAGYRDIWPTDKQHEILVSCDGYFLLNTSILGKEFNPSSVLTYSDIYSKLS